MGKLIVSTTTSLFDAGLLDHAEDLLEREYPIDLFFVSVGTSLAIQHAQRGNADMILVRALSREIIFTEEVTA